MDSSSFQYVLPQELIANKPASPRDSSRLFVYNTNTNEIAFDFFYHLHKYIPQNAVMVFNQTKVLPARVILHKSTGGKVEVLFLVNECGNDHRLSNTNTIRVFVDRKVEVGERLFINPTHFVTVISQEEHIFTVVFDFSVAELFSLLEKKGTMPVPLYIKNSSLDKKELRKKYQTVFAQNKGSAAAPTASLHFTNRLLKKLKGKGIGAKFVTLHVGMGTFAPVTLQQISDKKLHEEWYEIDSSTLQSLYQSQAQRKHIVAVGTTVVRTLESVKIGLNRFTLSRVEGLKSVKSVVGKTDLFIYPPYDFKMVDHMITNFHLPGSSLMMLVEAFLQYKKAKKSLIELYRVAVKEKFRFYSFGDGMLIL